MLNPLIALMIPLNLWDDFLGMLGALMTPLYWAVSGILVGFHTVLSNVHGPELRAGPGRCRSSC